MACQAQNKCNTQRARMTVRRSGTGQRAAGVRTSCHAHSAWANFPPAESHWPYGPEWYGGHASAARRTIAEGASEADQSQGVFGGVHCACKCQGLSTLSWSSTADDDEGAVRPQADEDGARMATAGGRLHLRR